MNRREVKRAPVLRFKGFTNDWEQRKLGDISEIIRGASPRPISDPKWFNSNSNIGWLRISDVTAQHGRIQHLSQHISILGQAKTRVISTPHLLLSIAASVGYPVINYVKTGVHDGFLIFENPKFNIDFGFYWLAFYKHEWQKFGQPGSQVNLNSSIVKKTNIGLPDNVEQKAIVHLLKLIDNCITLQQRKLKLLKVMKKALSQYMFCQEIEFVPILRFNSFSDKWKYERLKNLIVKEIKGKAKADMKGTKSTYIDTALLNGGSITKVDSPTDTFHNDIIILWDGSQAGKIYHGFTGALGSTLKSYKPKYSGGFLYQYLKSKEPIIFLRYRTPNIPHVVKDFTEIFKINVPSVKEQEKISKTLNYLDQSILVETKKIGSIKKIKKFLLQNMFI